MKKFNFMKFRINKQFYILTAILYIFLSCESEYSKFVKDELATGVKNDSLFFGMKFNDTQQEFFSICQELNKKEMITHGPQNRFAEYTMKSNDEGDSSIQMLFYGIFDKESIMTGVNMRFSYNGWFPNNQKFYSDKLIPRIQDTLKAWFPGNDFLKVNLKDLNKDAYVKIDGNRQIKMYALDEKMVAVRIEDLDKKSDYNDQAK